MATNPKAVLGARLHALEEVLDLIQRDLDDEDEPVNSVANDVEVLRHKTLAEIKAASSRDYPLPEAVEDGAFDEYAQDIWDGLTKVGIDFNRAVELAGDNPTHAMDQRRAIFLGKLADLEIAFGEYMGEVHNQ